MSEKQPEQESNQEKDKSALAKSQDGKVEKTELRRVARRKRVQKLLQILGFPSSGVGIAATIHFLGSGDLQQAAIAGGLTVGVTVLAVAGKFVSGVISRILDKIEEELENLEEPLANWIVVQLKKSALNLWWSLNPKFERAYYQSLVDSFRELETEGFRIGLPVLDLEDVYVPLRVHTEIPEKLTGGMIGEYRDSGSQRIWDFLGQSTKKKFQAYRRLAVIGSPGSGKTTLLRHLTLIYSKKLYGKYKAPSFIPVLLYLRDVRNLITTEQSLSLVELIEDHIKKLPAPQRLTPRPNWVKDRLKIGKFLVMLDGLDEVASESQRQKVSEWVNQQMKTYRRTSFIVTSRPHGFRSTPVEQVGTVLEVLPFNQKQMEEFIYKWYLQTEIMSRAGRDTPAVLAKAKNHAQNLIERIISSRAIADMAKNPLLVTMIATVHYCGKCFTRTKSRTLPENL